MRIVVIFAIAFLSRASYGENEESKIKYLNEHVKTLTRQVMLQQFFTEQRVRSEGQSGVKLIRQRRGGTKNYFIQSHTGYAAMAIHDHANNDRTVGMGEFTGVLNGIEFRTRHNDYRLYKPHDTSKAYHAVESVPFPDVPPAVLEKKTVNEQVNEMRAWFKAWQDQDYSKRDYRKYFKPVLCYLEGAWTTPGKTLDEGISDRHFIDAASWMELHEKARYVAYSGAKSLNENLSFLPTKIMSLINDTIPSFAQWNYRILCHPVKRDIPLARLRVVEDLSSRLMSTFDQFRHKQSRGARFQLNSRDQRNFHDRPISGDQLLDEIMAEIPGKNNYNSFLKDEGLEGEALNIDKSIKDVSKYHRWFRINGRDAMGTSTQHRGYSDDSLFMALTTQPQVAGVDLKKCTKTKPKKCHIMKQRWTYAVPLELIYLTPLYSWNPYKLKHWGDGNNVNTKKATAGGRNGGCESSTKKAYNGTTSRLYYRTPSNFFTGGVNNKDSADTARGVTCVLDQSGKMKYVRASGTHVFLPEIKGVGVVRQRYPIFPVHGEGSSVWKELNALREIVLEPEKWKYLREKSEHSSINQSIIFEMGYSNTQKTSKHTHRVELTPEENVKVRSGGLVKVTSSTENGHSHDVIIYYSALEGSYFYSKCDGNNNCWDRHYKRFNIKV